MQFRNPGGLLQFFFFFFHSLYFYPLACFRVSASRDFCGNVFLVIYKRPQEGKESFGFPKILMVALGPKGV